MFLDEILTSGAIPTLEATLRFAGARQAIINHNIANLETPYFRPKDASPRKFQQALSRAIESRRESGGGMSGDLEFDPTPEMRIDPSGQMQLSPTTASGNILFHDHSNSDLERLMQANTENAAVYRMASELLRGRYQQLRDVMADRV
jgi:flagellar basal-body rod protein FlgB